jgi:hypothetical protein
MKRRNSISSTLTRRNLGIDTPNAATLARQALAAHGQECRECGNPDSDSRCPQGERYEAAVQTDRSWIPEMEA